MPGQAARQGWTLPLSRSPACMALKICLPCWQPCRLNNSADSRLGLLQCPTLAPSLSMPEASATALHITMGSLQLY